jgi:hypothetical protein
VLAKIGLRSVVQTIKAIDFGMVIDGFFSGGTPTFRKTVTDDGTGLTNLTSIYKSYLITLKNVLFFLAGLMDIISPSPDA